MPQPTDDVRDPAARAVEHAAAAAASAGLAAAAAAEAVGSAAAVMADVVADVADVAADRGREVGREVARVVRDGAELLPTPAVLEGVLEDAFDRGADAWDALRGRRTVPRRWPWAAGSALAGAAAAVAVTVLARRLSTQDAPGAQEPEQVQAVVDHAPVLDPAAAAAPVVDEDGEAVLPD